MDPSGTETYIVLPQMFPEAAGLSSGAFVTCSADDTIRLWQMEDRTQTHVRPQNILSSVSCSFGSG